MVGSLSETVFALNHYEEAINYIDRAIQLEREEGREAKLRVRLAQKATILAGSGKRQEAVEIFDSIIPYFRTTGNHQSLAISLNKAGQALLEMGNTNEAKQRQAAAYFRESARLCREMDNPYNEMQARRGLYQALWTLNPDSARIELEAFNQLKDSLYNQASVETLARYNAEFGVDELQEQNTSVRRSRTYIVIIGVVLYSHSASGHLVTASEGLAEEHHGSHGVETLFIEAFQFVEVELSLQVSRRVLPLTDLGLEGGLLLN